jgi:uncharacterized protein YcbK (DUF882 family)
LKKKTGKFALVLDGMNCKHISNSTLSRRSFLKKSLQVICGVSIAAKPLSALAQYPSGRSLSFYHTHTRECLEITYAHGNDYDIQSLQQIDEFLRDFRTGDVFPIDRKLLDSLWSLQQEMGYKGTFEVISGYRSPKTNTNLRKVSNGVAKRSLHMQGKAIDVRFSNAPTKYLQQCAIALECGGVGYYPKSNFVHIDTGRVRAW